VFDDAARTVTITGYPRKEITTASRWPTGLEPTYNALAVDQAWYATNGFDTSNFGGGSDNGFGDDGPFGPGGVIAQVSAVGRQFSISLRFLAAGTGSKGSEAQRGMWFETINTPRGAINYNQGALEIGMGNYSQYYSDAANTIAESKGALRMFMPDTWTSLGFGVTGASAPEVVQGAIRVTRSEPTEGGGAPSVVNATTTPLPGSGVVLDVGEVGFSLPTYRTARNTAVRAQRTGNRVKLTFKLSAKQAKGTVTVMAGTRKLKKVATAKAKKGTNTITVPYKRGNGYVVKLGRTVIGSAVVR
jgi:hypothetical protein